jgi:IS30 family transposase
MAHYRRLNLMEREEVSRLLAAGYSLRASAQALHRAPSTVSRELARHHTSPLTYRAVPAHHRAQRRAHPLRKPRKLAIQPRLRAAVFQLLAQRWSPEQIAHGLPQRYPDDPAMRISHEAIYTYLYVLPRGAFKRELARYRRRRHRFRRPRKVRLSSRPVQDIISIDERPAEVADRTVPGHWEGDLLVGHANASALGTLVARTTRFTLLVPLKAKDATAVRRAFAREVRTLPAQLRRSLTYDQGQEMREHRLFTKETKMRVYFAHPQCPWERGTNETPMACCGNSFPQGLGSIAYRGARSRACRPCSTIGRGRFSIGIVRPMPFTNCCIRTLNAH